jgi:ribose 5-phosphate isomerase B
MKIVLASDHGGFELKEKIKNILTQEGKEFVDVGCDNTDSCDYPQFAHAACSQIKDGDLGIFICGSGNGIAMAANSHKHIRAAVCWDAELASLARAHNNANVMTLPGRFISEQEALDCVCMFVETDFEGGRHSKRVRKIKFVPGLPISS